MSSARTTKTKPISVRLSPDERSLLEAQAGKLSLGEYVRARLFGDDRRTRHVPSPKVDARHLAHVLAALGQADLAPTLRELLRSVKVGDLPSAEQTEAALAAACEAIMEMRRHLMVALGLVEENGR